MLATMSSPEITCLDKGEAEHAAWPAALLCSLVQPDLLHINGLPLWFHHLLGHQLR